MHGIIGLIVVGSFLPVWRSGEKGKLSFWAWVKNHTIWGDEVMYVPAEQRRKRRGLRYV